MRVLWQHIVLCKGTLLRMRLTMGVRSVLRCERVSCNVTHYAHPYTHSQAHSQQRTLTQHDMLPQHPNNIKELISGCF